MSDYEEPEDIYEAMADLEFDKALDSDDPRYVDTLSARGDDFSIRNLYRYLRVNDSDPEHLKLPKKMPTSSYNLFCGHIGCGKSTELRRLQRKLHQSDLFCVVFLDVLEELDIHNLSYADLLLALAKQLFETLEQEQVDINPLLLENLQQWFAERVETQEQLKTIAGEIRSEAKVGVGIPFLSYLFTSMTGYMQNSNSYKEEIRKVITNSFNEFAQAFNQCIAAANDAVQKAGKGQRILFIVDGTDRLRNEDGVNFFIKDVYQLAQIESYFIYCSPIHLLYENNQIHRSFKVVTLPMIKLHDREKNILDENYQVMRNMVFQRFPQRFFTDSKLIDQLIEFSGGCPRELLRLLDYAFLALNGDKFDATAVDKAINHLAVDYKRILDTDDYALLAQIDQTHQADFNSDKVRRFLYNMIVLEYNNFWREPHPAIRRLPAFQEAIHAI
jgi:hypothetical protein